MRSIIQAVRLIPWTRIIEYDKDDNGQIYLRQSLAVNIVVSGNRAMSLIPL